MGREEVAMVGRFFRIALALAALSVGITFEAGAQIATGAITGAVIDNSGAMLPGVTVTLSGDRLIGGAQSQVTDSGGRYRFDRLPPGPYNVRFELAGFRPVQRQDIVVNATFTATVNEKLEVGQLQETITVVGESPTIDTKSNVQQTVMSQALLEGMPTGRDPWSVAKIIPGVQVSTYDVGGTQGMQQSGITSHGSNSDDKIFAIDGLNINWPGGGGGSTMVYYDQGMFEEVNYQTSAIPAEVAIGGVYMNMVTKEGGNAWRGDLKYYYAHACAPDRGCSSWQADNLNDQLRSYKNPDGSQFFLGGNPVTRQYDFNLSGGGALQKDHAWLFAALRDWRVDKQTLGARNPDGSFAIDDNRIRNYSGKLTYAAARNHKLGASWNYNWKERFHRRDTPPNFVEDKASYIQQQPGYSTQLKYTGILNSRAVFESGLGYMHGVFPLHYQNDVKPTDIRVVDNALSTACCAAQRNYDNPNSRIQFDNTFSYTANALGGSHVLKAGVQFARQYYREVWRVNGDQYIVFNNTQPNSVQIWNTPTAETSYARQVGYYVQDSWTLANRITLNLGGRLDTATGWYPDEEIAAGTFTQARHITGRTVTNQMLGVWRLGLVYDAVGDGKTALKANYSRYGNQVGIDRVTSVHPSVLSSGTRTWTDRNTDRIPQADELGAFSGFSEQNTRYARADGPDWPRSDEITAGVERQLARNVRVGAMYYHRSNRNQIGTRNVKVPSTAYTAVTIPVPTPSTDPSATKGPGGTATVYNLDSAFFGSAFIDNVRDNDPYLDTDYDGIEFTASKRFSDKWQLLAGLTIGKNTGGITGTGQLSSADLNDLNNTTHPTGIVGNDSKYSMKVSGTYVFPYNISISGSLLWNQGYPYVSTFNVTRTQVATLTRASQTVFLSARGDERFKDVVMGDVRISRPFRFGQGRQISPQLDLFNLGNAATVVGFVSGVGRNYLYPSEILAPRIARVGLAVSF
jgi:hypothetical protein